MARKPLIQARVEPDTKSALEDYAESEDLSQSEALRDLLNKALASEGYDAKGSRSLLERLASVKMVLGGAFLFFLSALLWVPVYFFGQNGDYIAALMIVGVLMLLAISGALAISVAALAQLALARPLRGLVGLYSGVAHE